MLKKLPNILTISRIAVIPLLIASFYLENKLSHQVAAGLFLIASITDFFDGYLARIWQSQSKLGKCLDPIADKLLVAAAILMLVHFGRVDILPAVAILCREILVSGLREFLAEINVSIPVSKLAKIKTGAQMTAITLLLFGSHAPLFLDLIIYEGISIGELLGRILMWIAAILTIITGYAYLKAGLHHMNKEK